MPDAMPAGPSESTGWRQSLDEPAGRAYLLAALGSSLAAVARCLIVTAALDTDSWIRAFSDAVVLAGTPLLFGYVRWKLRNQAGRS